MYKCKECGTEYEVKPDYCDCGNDEFEEIGAEAVIEAKSPSVTAQQETVAGENKVIAEDLPKVKPASSMNFNNSTMQSYAAQKTLSVAPVSILIFIVCILLSIYIVFFAWNSGFNNESETNSQNDVESQVGIDTTKIPSVDKIWNNALPVVKQEEHKNTEVVENVVKQILPVQSQKKTETKQTPVSKPKTTAVPLTKTTQTAKQKTNTSTKVQTNTTSQQSKINAQEQAKKAAEEAAKKKAEQERLAAEAAQIKKLQAEQAKKVQEEKAKKDAQAKQDYIAYKAQLRNAIGRKIDFTRVIGDGSCTVAFKIDSTGRIVNRSFAKQSSNNTLNDAVYAAVMATPTFNPPPSAYNNETLNLNIKFYNGNFEISLP